MIAFDIDTKAMSDLADRLGATEKNIQLSINRALRRTAATIRVMSSKGLTNELQLRRAGEIRKRLREMKLRSNRAKSEIRLWYGLNDMRVSSFKGTPRDTSDGASFRNYKFSGAFVGKNKDRRKTIFKRVGEDRLPISEQTIPVKDQMEIFIEDVIFPDIGDIFMKNFTADLRARTMFGDTSWDRRGGRG